jgi:hypothetical protein
MKQVKVKSVFSFGFSPGVRYSFLALVGDTISGQQHCLD